MYSKAKLQELQARLKETIENPSIDDDIRVRDVIEIASSVKLIEEADGFTLRVTQYALHCALYILAETNNAYQLYVRAVSEHEDADAIFARIQELNSTDEDIVIVNPDENDVRETKREPYLHKVVSIALYKRDTGEAVEFESVDDTDDDTFLVAGFCADTDDLQLDDYVAQIVASAAHNDIDAELSGQFIQKMMRILRDYRVRVYTHYEMM